MAYDLIETPDPHAVETLFGECKRRNACLGLFTRCAVEYDGRASSSLAQGDRFVMTKPDGTVLVHTDQQRTPQNWQPPGATIQITETDPLTFTAIRTSPKEVITIRCATVHFAVFIQMTDNTTLDLEGSEDDLRDLIFTEPDRIEPGFRPHKREYETPAGPVDVWGHDTEGTPVILEPKRRRVGPDAVSQLRRYVESVEPTVRGILVAPSVTDRADNLLADFGLEKQTITPPSAGHSVHHSLTEFGTTE